MEDVEETIGPGSDLAISLAGILLVLLISAFVWVSSLQLEKSSAQAQLSDKQLTIDNLQNLIDLHKRDEQTMKIQEDALAALETQLKDMQDLIDTLSAEIENKKKRLAQNQREFSLQAEEMDALLEKLGAAESELRRGKQDLRDAERVIQVLKDQNDQEKLTTVALKDGMEELRGKLNDQSSNLTRTIHLLDGKRQQALELATRVEELNARIRQLRKALSDTRQSLDSVKRQLVTDSAEEEDAQSIIRSQSDEILNLVRQVAKLEGDIDELNNRHPPFINVADAKNKSLFGLGSAELSSEFKKYIGDTLAPLILTTALELDAKVIEVVGHTDEVPVGKKSGCNFDEWLLFAANDEEHPALVSCSNVDLGMARAVTVANELRKSGVGNSYTIRSLSAGQTTLTDEKIRAAARRPRKSLENANRRRIEIRIRKFVQEVTGATQ